MNSRNPQELLHTPEGVWDHYGRDYAEYLCVEERINTQMHRYGYEDIKTPTFEYFDIFSAEIGTIPSRELYKFFDKDGNTLVLRPDFTPSVARCAAKYYMDEQEPLRFCYQGSAFVNNSNLQGNLKESTQMGAELMNDPSVYADAEVIALLTGCLQAAGLSRFQISIGNTQYFKGVCEEAGLDSDTQEQLRAFLSGKNYYAAADLLTDRGVAQEYTDQFLQIAEFSRNDSELEPFLKSAPNQKSAEAVQRLIDLYHVLQQYGCEQYVSFDLSLLSKYQYYTGVIFKAYTYGTGDAVASGGRYDLLLSYFGKKAASIGFMIRIDNLLEAARGQGVTYEVPDPPQIVYYTDKTYAQALQEVRKRRADGERVILAPHRR